MKQPYFSIIVPIYNTEKYIERCVNSILNQRIPDFEIILVDDGSKDNSGTICDNLAQKDRRIKVIHKENAGLGMARNTGVENANGDYVLFVDSDDYISADILYDLSSEIKNGQFDVVFFGMTRVDLDGNILFDLKPNVEKVEYYNPNDIKENLLADFIGYNPHSGERTNLRISVCTSCIKLDIIKNNALKFVSEREYISEDIWFYLDLFKYISSCKVIEKEYYFYIQNSNSLTTRYKKDRFEKIKFFYTNAKTHVNELGYSNEIILRLNQSYFATTLGCMKIEASYISEEHTKKDAINKIRTICNDEEFRKSFFGLPDKHFNKKWKVLKILIKYKMIMLLFLVLRIQYKKSGI